ncbi:hypothetical protein PQG76_10965, partial [Corynebacterium falsenii]|uniref:hypothetical protein n=2 Tax=Corynebacterium TaxID=1716 RepID=UPI00234DB50C
QGHRFTTTEDTMAITTQQEQDIKAFEIWMQTTFGYTMEFAVIDTRHTTADIRREARAMIGEQTISHQAAEDIWKELDGTQMRTIGNTAFFNPNVFITACAVIIEI